MQLGQPARGLAFIERIDTQETYSNSPIIVTPKTRDQISKQQFTVLAVGGWERCDEDDCERVHVTDDDPPDYTRVHFHNVDVGDWVICRNRSWGETPDPKVFVVRCDDILARFTET